MILTRSRLGLLAVNNSHFWFICNRVMTLDLCQNFVSTQYMYLENRWIDLYALILTILGWDCYLLIFAYL